jgi:hypothetical protein
VAVDVHQYNLPTRGEDRPAKLQELIKGLKGPTLVYCQSPHSAAAVSRQLIREAMKTRPLTCASAAHWMADNFHPEWSAVKAISHGVGLHHGAIPRALQQQMVRMFNTGAIRVLICTSTLIEGVNTSAENVIIYDRRKSKNVLDFFTYKNIQGRAGRMGRYFVGNVFVLERPPTDEDVVVEYKLEDQASDTPIGMLIQLDDSDLTDESRSRIEDELQGSFLSRETIRLNGSLDPRVQNELARRVDEMLRSGDRALLWSGFPQGLQLLTSCELIYQYISGPYLAGRGISSGRQLVWHLRNVSQKDGIPGYLHRVVNGRLSGQSAAEKIDEALKIIRNVVTFRFPRDLMVLERIVKEVSSRLKMPAPDYSTYTEASENMFTPWAIAALEEYGIPIQLAKKISSHLDRNDLDRSLERLRAIDWTETPGLSNFELDLLRSVQDAL